MSHRNFGQKGIHTSLSGNLCTCHTIFHGTAWNPCDLHSAWLWVRRRTHLEEQPISFRNLLLKVSHWCGGGAKETCIGGPERPIVFHLGQQGNLLGTADHNLKDLAGGNRQLIISRKIPYNTIQNTQQRLSYLVASTKIGTSNYQM